jgi:hypothetical protein
LRALGNRVLRKITGTKMDDVTGSWRKFHNEVFNDFYSSSYVLKVIKSTWKILVGRQHFAYKA